MKAEPAAQARLLDLQELDLEIQRLDHRAATLPEAEEAARASELADRLDRELIAAQTRLSDAERAQRKAENDVEQVRSRAARNTERLESGRITNGKELQNLQSEIASLGRRQGELEEIVLEVMEQVESLSSEVARLTAAVDRARVDHTAKVAHRDTVAAEIGLDRARAVENRQRVSEDVPAPLLSFYDKLRAQYSGVGAAPLRHGRCEGCKIVLSPAEIGEIRSAAPDEVVRCEECRRILIRISEPEA